MGLVQRLKQQIDPAPPITSQAFRKGRPQRRDSVRQEVLASGMIVLTAPLSLKGRGFAGWVARRMKLPDEKSYELEEMGAFVWTCCDGRATFDAISKRLQSQYKMNRLEADAALAAFLQTLGRRGLIEWIPGKAK